MQDDTDDAHHEPEVPSSSDDYEIDESEGDLKKKIQELKKKLSSAEKDKLEYLTGWQRTKADFVNASRRAEEERLQVQRYASEAIIDDLIPVLDSFDGALSSKEVGQWGEGLGRIHNQLLQLLRSRGLELIDKVGVAMDPRLHEAIQLVGSSPEHPPHTVVSVLQKGYRLHDRVIRAAKVVVSE